MTRSLEQIEEAIARERRALDEWLCLTYAGQESERYCGEIEVCYGNWGPIKSIAGAIFDGRQVRRLERASLDSLLFFISRSEESGGIIAWLTSREVKRFSHCGDLSYEDFLFLAEEAAKRDEDFCDYQFAASFEKCSSLDDRAVNLLHEFFRRKDSYTRRRSIHALALFRHPSVCELAIDLWRTDSCEFAKLSCLHALKEAPGGKSIFDEFLREYKRLYDVDAADYRKSHIQVLMGA